jgi:hypothetical protein
MWQSHEEFRTMMDHVWKVETFESMQGLERKLKSVWLTFVMA